MLDVRDPDAITALAAELGEVDIVFSNATSRMRPDADPADEVDAVAETNDLAATRVLRAFAPRMRPGGRLIIVASALGTLDKLDERRSAPVRGRGREPRRRRRAGRTVARRRQGRARRHGGLRHVAEHPVEGRPGRRRPRDRPRTPSGRPGAGAAHRRAVPWPDRHRCVTAVVRGHEQRPDSRRRPPRGPSRSPSMARSTRRSTASSCSSAGSCPGRRAYPWRTGQRRSGLHAQSVGEQAEHPACLLR